MNSPAWFRRRQERVDGQARKEWLPEGMVSPTWMGAICSARRGVSFGAHEGNSSKQLTVSCRGVRWVRRGGGDVVRG